MAIKLEWRIAALANGFKDSTAYRWEFIFDILGSALVPAAIQSVLWYAIFKVGGAAEVSGMTYTDMIHYTLFSVLFTQIRGGDHDFELAEMIRSGQLSQYILRPVGVVEFVYIRGVASKLFVAGLSLAVGLIVATAFGYNPLRMLGSVAMAIMGNVIHYQIGAIIASSAFYWEESYSLLMVKNMLVSFLSGELLPLSLFPEKWSWVWKSTPFYLYVYGPTQFALGKWSIEEFGWQMLICAAWIAGASLLIRLSWGVGIKKYSSLGG